MLVVIMDKAKMANGLPWWLSGKEFAYECRKLRFNPWVGKVPWRKKWQPAPVFLPGKANAVFLPGKEEPGRYHDRGVHGVAKSQTQLSMRAPVYL